MHCVLPLYLIWMHCITFCRSVVGLQKSNQFVHAIIMYVSEISYLFWSCVMSGEYLTCETVCFFIWQFHTPHNPFLIVVNHNMLVFMCCRSLKCRCSNCTKLSCLEYICALCLSQCRKGRTIEVQSRHSRLNITFTSKRDVWTVWEQATWALLNLM